MKIAMIGSGAAGSVFAAYLRRGGAELYLVDRYKAHMDKVAKDGMKFTFILTRPPSSPALRPRTTLTTSASWTSSSS